MSTDWQAPDHTCRPPSPCPQALATAACRPAEPHFHQSEYYSDGAAAMWQQAAQQPQLAFVPTAADYAAVCEPGLAASYPGAAGWQQGAAYSGGFLPMVTGGPQQLVPEPQPAPDALGERFCRPWLGPVPCRTALPRPACMPPCTERSPPPPSPPLRLLQFCVLACDSCAIPCGQAARSGCAGRRRFTPALWTPSSSWVRGRSFQGTMAADTTCVAGCSACTVCRQPAAFANCPVACVRHHSLVLACYGPPFPAFCRRRAAGHAQAHPAAHGGARPQPAACEEPPAGGQVPQSAQCRLAAPALLCWCMPADANLPRPAAPKLTAPSC